MSLSNEETRSQWGTIFMGPSRSMETTLEKVEDGRPSLAWTMGTEEEYLERVRSKAAVKAKEIILAAQTEAQALHDAAHTKGYEAGLAQAQAELAEFRQGMGESVAAVLAAIKAEAPSIALAWRNDLNRLLKVCVETALNHELDANRQALLSSLLDNAMLKMVEQQRINIAVSPDDEPAVSDMVDAAGKETGQVFTVRADAQLPPGSMVLESEQSRVDNSFGVRRAMVEQILAELVLSANTPQEAELTQEQTAEPEPAAPELAEQNFDAAATVPEAYSEPAREDEPGQEVLSDAEPVMEPVAEPVVAEEDQGEVPPEMAVADNAEAVQPEAVLPESELAAEPDQTPDETALAPEPVAEPDLKAMSENELLADIMADAGLEEVPLPEPVAEGNPPDAAAQPQAAELDDQLVAAAETPEAQSEPEQEDSRAKNDSAETGNEAEPQA